MYQTFPTRSILAKIKVENYFLEISLLLRSFIINFCFGTFCCGLGAEEDDSDFDVDVILAPTVPP